MERNLEANWLTTADVARRLGVQGGTVRHYGEILRGRGYNFVRGESGEWLWSPEAVEIARAAYLVAKATPGVSFERALDYLEYAGRVALASRAGTTLPEAVQRLGSLPERLQQVVQRLEDDAGAVMERLEGGASAVVLRVTEDLRRRVNPLIDAVSAQAQAMRSAVAEVRGVMSVLVFMPSVVLLVQNGLLTLVALGQLSLPGWAPWLGVALLVLAGFFLGWWYAKG